MKLFQLVRMVLWGFFGVRKRAGLESDLGTLHPVQVIAVALVLAAAFVVSLLLIVKAAISA